MASGTVGYSGRASKAEAPSAPDDDEQDSFLESDELSSLF